jgi:hypothetical protein
MVYWIIGLRSYELFFSNYTVHRRHSQRTHTHPYEYAHANPTPRSIFEDRAGKSSRLTKSPQAPRCRRERRLPLKAQMSLNPEKFAPTGSRTQDLRCYRGSCNHKATCPFAVTSSVCHAANFGNRSLEQSFFFNT